MNSHTWFQACSYYSLENIKTKIRSLREVGPFLKSTHICDECKEGVSDGEF